MPSYRLEQIGHQIQAELSDLLLREVRDPRLGFVTITQVNVSSDLSIARVNISCYGDETEQKESLRALKHAAGIGNHDRRLLNQQDRVQVRQRPDQVQAFRRRVMHGVEGCVRTRVHGEQ